MRVTTKAYTQNFLKNNNSLLSKMLKSESKILSQRKYNRASEDSVSAAKAAHVRKSIANLAIYDENCKTAKDFFYSAETVLYDIAGDTYPNSVKPKLISAQDTKDQTQLNILAQEIQEMADHMVQDMNTDFAERQMFGSTSNDKTPFTTFASVKVFDKNGNEVGSFGNEPDIAESAEQFFFFNGTDTQFYDSDGKAIDDYTALISGSPLYDSAGNKYPVAVHDGMLEDSDGRVYTDALPAGTPVTTKPDPVVFRMNDEKFYDKDGNEIADYTAAADDTELYDSKGVKYTVTVKGGKLTDMDGTVYDKVYTPSQKYYDEDGDEIQDLSNYNGKRYYDMPKYIKDANGKTIKNPDFSDNAVRFIVKGSPDISSSQKERVVCYNDVPINLSGDELLAAVDGGTIAYYNDKGELTQTKVINTPAERGDAYAFPGSNPIYVDIGLGIKYDEKGTVINDTALDMSLNGAVATGYGTDKDGDSYNMIQLCYDAAKALREGDLSTANRYIDKLDAANTTVLNAITDLGIKQNNMDFYVSKNEIYNLSLLEKQNDLEGCDLEAEITNWKTISAAYNAALSMGANILPKSLFDFI